VPLIGGKNDADRLANLTSEVPIGRLNLDNYAKQLRTGNARICRVECAIGVVPARTAGIARARLQMLTQQETGHSRSPSA
jgi:hypothetical protein